MGDPKKHRKKYSGPSHPWEAARIEKEGIFTKEFGLKNKQEIWKTDSVLKKFKTQAKNLVSKNDAQATREGELLIKKLYSLGLVDENAKFDNILVLETRDMLKRRLKTVVAARGLARSVKQARQFVTHRHITVGGKLVDAPSYIVKRAEENNIAFASNSELSNPEHAERVVEKQVVPKLKIEETEKVKEAPKTEEKAAEVKE